MGQDSSIEWTDRTWNPVRGCSRVSDGCTRCYAEKVAARFSGPGLAYEGLARRTLLTVNGENVHRGRWTGEVRMVPEHLADPLRWKKPRRIFVNSMSDLFHEKFSNEDIAAVFGVMAAAPRHTFQVLTKRARRMRDWFTWVDAAGGLPKWLRANWATVRDRFAAGSRFTTYRGKEMRSSDDAGSMVLNAAGVQVWPLPWVHLGVSVEDQQRADERITDLLATPAAVRFVSYEPALGPVDFANYLGTVPRPASLDPRAASYPARIATPHRLDWVIVGGESGPGARPFDVGWARAVVEECKAADVACFVKQLGANPGNGTLGWFSLDLKSKKGADMSEWPEDLRVREFPR